jgi:GT2 family glycosyltransferase
MSASSFTSDTPSGLHRPLAPGVVATLLVRNPSVRLDEVLSSLADQDYPNLQVLILVAEADPSAMNYIASVAKTRLPGGHLRQVAGDPGFGQAVNAVLKLVEGTDGYFLFLTDEVALAPDAVRIMVEEAFRSNAGVVGPKFVEWDDPQRLISVGFECDRLGEVDSGIEPHEMDQEQHDAVADVFMLPSSCILVRADLFHALRGFESSISTSGEDLDLCWRAHLSGARVMVVPSAVVRFDVEFAEGRLPFDVASERERSRVLTVASLTGLARLPLIAMVMVVLGISGSIWSVLRGRTRRARVQIGAIGGLLGQLGMIAGRRRRVRRTRRVSDGEIAGLQVRGSIRWRRMRRKRELRLAATDPSEAAGRRSESLSLNSMIVGFGLAFLFLLGARTIISSGSAAIGDLLPLDVSARDLLSSYGSGWWERDLGSSSPQPTANGLTAFFGFAVLGNMGLLHTLLTIGLIPLGWMGAARLLSMIDHERARLTGIVVYAAVPLPYAAVAAGRHQVLVAYAAIPWALHLVRTFSGLGGPVADEDHRDVVERLAMPRRVKAVAKLSLLMAVTMAFAPVVVVAILTCVILWLLAATLAGGSVRTAGFAVVAVTTALSAAVVLNMPWSLRFLSSDGWSMISGPDVPGGRELSWWEVMRFGIGPTTLGALIMLLYVPLVVAPIIARHSRFIWALRGLVLVIGGIALTTLNASDRLPFRLADNGVLLAIAAMGLSLGVAVTVLSLSVDVLGGKFGWRQPTAILSLVVIPVGVFPVATMAVSGRWNQPTTTLYSQINELVSDTQTGDFRTLVIGDSRLVVSGSHELGDGLAYSLLGNSTATFLDRWTPEPKEVDRLVEPYIEAVAQRSTLRVGRILAPLGIRYIVIPVVDRVSSTSSSPLPLPSGLVESFSAQLDLEKVYSPPSMVIFENSQWIPVTSLLSASALSASDTGGASALVSSELSGSTPILGGTTAWSTTSQSIGPGRVHLGIPFTSQWVLENNGRRISGKPSFGSVMYFDVGEGGTVTLVHDGSVSRTLWIVIQAIVWIAVLLAAVQPRRRRRRSTYSVDDGPVLSLNNRPGRVP